MKQIVRWIPLLLVLIAGPASALVIDHHCTDESQIPSAWIDQAKTLFRVGYGHTSHGSQLVTGMEVVAGTLGAPFVYTSSGWGLTPGLFLNDYWGNAGGADDLGHNGYLGWRDATVAMLGLPENDRNVVIWSWCGGVHDNTPEGINIYLNAMDALEDAYPGVIFVYMTGHLEGTGEGGNLHLRNEQIRAFCVAQDKLLYDFADIESYDPDGNYFLNQGADDECNYDGGNWATQWCSAHPGSVRCSSCDCAHSHSLNCNLKGRAFWWMMARLAGWPGPGGEPTATPTTPAGTPTPPAETPTPTFTPTVPSGTPTPTPEPGSAYVWPWMPAEHFRPGEPCRLTAFIRNPGTGDALPLYIVLGVEGSYYFWPFWGTTPDHGWAVRGEAEREEKVIDEFLWPSGFGSADGLCWYGAMTNPEGTAVHGDWGCWEFGFSE